MPIRLDELDSPVLIDTAPGTPPATSTLSTGAQPGANISSPVDAPVRLDSLSDPVFLENLEPRPINQFLTTPEGRSPLPSPQDGIIGRGVRAVGQQATDFATGSAKGLANFGS